VLRNTTRDAKTSGAGAAGVEPTNGGTKNRCLATWRRPSLYDAPCVHTISKTERKYTGFLFFMQVFLHIKTKNIFYQQK